MREGGLEEIFGADAIRFGGYASDGFVAMRYSRSMAISGGLAAGLIYTGRV